MPCGHLRHLSVRSIRETRSTVHVIVQWRVGMDYAASFPSFLLPSLLLLGVCGILRQHTNHRVNHQLATLNKCEQASREWKL